MGGKLEFGNVRRNIKYNILILIILVMLARLFFSFYLTRNVLAEKIEKNLDYQKISSIDPLKNINPENIFKKKEIKASYNKKKIKKDKKFKKEQEKIYENLVKDYPLAAMTSEIAKQDKKVAAFLIAIAKKESNWGVHSPKKDGKDCYNYWGYRGGYKATTSGYSCFDSPQQAIEVVGSRIEKLISQGINTPEKMIVWKCGKDCSWDNPVAVRKWVSDVSVYYHKLNS